MSDSNNGKQYMLSENAELLTQLKQLEEEKKNLIEQLEQSQKVEVVGRLASGVANDFSNMLSVILGHAEIALSWIDSSHHLYENLQEIYKAAEHSAELTRQLLTFARKQTHTVKVQDLNVTVSGILKLLRRIIGNNLELVWKPAETQCLVNADSVQINQILANLCVNAYEAIEDSGVISISVETVSIAPGDCRDFKELIPGDYVLVRVADNGCGMDAQTIANLYKPFHTTKDHGTGLGLPIVKEIVRQNGGFINVESVPGRGSTFSVYLPRFAEKTVSEPVAVGGTAKQGHETILLVDDDVALLGMTRRMLQVMGLTVLSVEKPSEAISLIKTNPGKINLLLTDLVMPEMNGRTLAKEICELRPDIECLFMSGYGEKIVAHHGLMDSNVNFIAKPFTREELSAAIAKILGWKHAAVHK
ncbi:MAG TPA: hybrid sensor histidine kinase/response regulator [Candidatus Riflebacteria bacterium]|jgi:nitrogen-specific signal transduction histidine kinase/ActR/RegA family two-component response regulator|nr:hybrid sensor histidine kinase/response regulator [Candidatus Riflebacteria bacterium]